MIRFARCLTASSTSASTVTSPSLLLTVSIDALARRRWFASGAAASTNVFTTVKHDAPLAQRIEAHQEAERKAKSNIGRPGYNEKGHKILSTNDIAEIKRLRAAEPARWTQRALARRFECSRVQIGMHASSTVRQQQHQVVQNIFAQRRLARDPSVRRERLQQYVANVTAIERVAWQTKLAQKVANKAAAVAAVEANEAAHRARRAEQDKERALADRNRSLASAAKAKLGKGLPKVSTTANDDIDDDDDDADRVQSSKNNNNNAKANNKNSKNSKATPSGAAKKAKK
jgi:hypothetical protein